jgi:hypothetical protein
MNRPALGRKKTYDILVKFDENAENFSVRPYKNNAQITGGIRCKCRELIA